MNKVSAIFYHKPFGYEMRSAYARIAISVYPPKCQGTVATPVLPVKGLAQGRCWRPLTSLYGKAGRRIDNLRSAFPVVTAQVGGHEDFKQRATSLHDLTDIETALSIKSDNHKI